MKKNIKKCPFCAENIKEEAVFCKHCKTSLNESGNATKQDKIYFVKKNDKPKEGLFLRTMNCGCAVIFIFIIFVIILVLASS